MRRAIRLWVVVWLVAIGWAEQPELAYDTFYQKTCIDSACHPAPVPRAVPLHPPYLERRCLTCHDDHRSTSTHLLKPGGNNLCLNCHIQVQVHELESSATHPPGAQACIECHAPHKSPVRSLLRHKEQLELCADCHQPFLETSRQAPYRHRHFDPKTQCGNCHYAHSRGEHFFLREDVAETCLTCHDLPIKIDGRPLENVARRLRQAPFVHEAIQEGSCPGCHTPHGSVQPALLKPGYPAGNYQAYQPENYDLCWECHDRQLVESTSGESVTAFRNGQNNLHRVHVMELRRGRGCHLCHHSHASDQPHLLRESFRYGNWDGPLKWEPLANGGRCQSACHRDKEYQR